MTLGLVCYRMGSKGLPGKNTRIMHGKPLYEWSLNAALMADLNGLAIVTDDPNVPHSDTYLVMPEPEHLAMDHVAKWDVWRWAVSEYQKLTGRYVNRVVDIDVTRPMREVDDIDACIRLHEKTGMDVVMAITEAKKSPYFDLLEQDRHGQLVLAKRSEYFLVRQAGPSVYEHGGIYVISQGALLEYPTFFADGMKILGVPVGQWNALDIDDKTDWLIVERIMAEWLKTQKTH